MFNKSGNKLDYEFIYDRLIEWGYGIHYNDKANMKDMVIVKKEGNFIDEVSVNDIFKELANYAREYYEDQNLSVLYENQTIINTSWYRHLPKIEVKKYRDARDSICLFFKNKVIKVKKDKIEEIDYENYNFGGYYIWKSDILDHEIDLSNFESEWKEGDWYKFCNNAVDDGLIPLMKSLGYLIHAYKDPAIGVIIVYAESSLGIEADGGTGKSVIAFVALQKIRQVSYIGGDTFKPDRDFKFQTIDPYSNVMIIDDVDKRFKYKSLYNVATNVMTVEQKHKGAINLPYTESPKVVVTTNYGILGQGESDKRRRTVIGFQNYYSKDYTPSQEFGRRFFEDWSEKDFNRFFLFFLKAGQLYLNEGLEDHNSRDVDIKALYAIEGEDFVEFVGDNIEEKWYGPLNKKTLDDIIEDLPRQYHKDTDTRTKNSFKRIVDTLGYKIEENIINKYGKTQRFKYLLKKEEHPDQPEQTQQPTKQYKLDEIEETNDIPF